MYGDIPLILQGAAQREALSPDQQTRLQAQGIPVSSTARVNFSSTLLPLIGGLVAAWYLAGGSRRRSLLSIVLLLLIPMAAMAQTVTPFVQRTVSGADTFDVYGKSLTTDSTTYVTTTTTKTFTTTVVDSVVRYKTPVVLGKPYGPTALYAETNKAPFTGSGGESSNKPQWLLDNINRARTFKIPMIAVLPCGAHSTNNLGNCLRDSSGVAVFSRARYDSAMATYNTPQVKAAVDAAYTDGWLLAVNLMDEPWVKGSGDGNTWGPNGLTRAQADTSCRTAKNGAFADVPVGVSDASPKLWPVNGYTFRWCDVGIPQFSYRFGSPAVWRDTMLVQVSQGKYGEIFSFNVVNGGTQDTDTVWDCKNQGGIKGTRAPNCTMTASQITTAVATLGGAGCGAQIMWRADSARFAKLGSTVFQQAVATQNARPKNPCKDRMP